MSRSPAILIALALTSSPAWAQDSGLGLDLTEDSTNKQEETQDETTSQEATPPPAAPVETPAADAAPAKPPEPQLTEGDITQEDRVKSVQRKVYLKRGRFELAPYVSVSINDPYYSKLGGFLRAGYYLADTLAIAGRFSLYQVLPSSDVRTAKQAFSSQIYYSRPQWSAIADVEWSPLYGKVAFLNSILHFDAYILGGLGIVNTATAERVDLATGTALGPARRGRPRRRPPLRREGLPRDQRLRDQHRFRRPAHRHDEGSDSERDHPQCGDLDLLPVQLDRKGGRVMNRLLLLGLLVTAAAPAFAEDKNSDGPPATEEKEAGDTSEVDRDVGPLRERIRPVSGNLFLKKGRFEFSPSASISMRDAFFTKYVFGGVLAYHPTEQLAIAIRAGYSLPTVSGARSSAPSTATTPRSRAASPPTFAQLDGSAPGQILLLGGLDAQWSPIYGKIAVLAEQFIHFDLYAVGGVAAVQYAGPSATGTGSEKMLTFGGNVGAGMHVFLNRWMTVRGELRNTIYSEKLKTGESDLRNQLFFELGLSFFFPNMPGEQ